MSEIVYKIQREDGLFSTGGTHPSFTKRGKIWRSTGDVKRHLRLVSNSVGFAEDTYSDCEVLEYVINPSLSMSVESFYADDPIQASPILPLEPDKETIVFTSLNEMFDAIKGSVDSGEPLPEIRIFDFGTLEEQEPSDMYKAREEEFQKHVDAVNTDPVEESPWTEEAEARLDDAIDALRTLVKTKVKPKARTLFDKIKEQLES